MTTCWLSGSPDPRSPAHVHPRTSPSWAEPGPGVAAPASAGPPPRGGPARAAYWPELSSGQGFPNSGAA